MNAKEKTEALREKIGDILEYETSLCLNPTEVGKDDCGNESGSLACKHCQLDQILKLNKEAGLEFLSDNQGNPPLLNDRELTKANRIPPKEYGAKPGWWLRVSRQVARAQRQSDKQFYKDYTEPIEVSDAKSV